MPIALPEEVEILAFRMYKLNEAYDKMIWRLAELCKTIQINLDGIHEKWCDLNAFKTLEEIKEHLKYDTIISPSHEEIKPIAQKLYEYHPERSKLHWYIAEKTLVFEKLKRK